MRNTKLRRLAVMAAGSVLFTGFAIGTATAATAGGHGHHGSGHGQAHGQAHAGSYSQSSDDEAKLKWLVAKWLWAHDYECNDQNVDALANALDDNDSSGDWDHDGYGNDSDVDLDLDVELDIELSLDLGLSIGG
jgi:hypothetical protein